MTVTAVFKMAIDGRHAGKTCRLVINLIALPVWPSALLAWIEVFDPLTV